jgi:hypothetical protein
MKISSLFFVVATVTAAPLALPTAEPQFGLNFGNIAGQLAGNFNNIAGQLASNFNNIAGQVAGNLGNLAGNFGNLVGNIPTIGDVIGDLCFVPILCDFIKIAETEKNGTPEEKEAAIKAFVADWDQATPEAKRLFAPIQV